MRGDGRVFLRGRIWWIAYYVDGREYRESSRSPDRRAAVKLLRQRIGEVAAGNFPHQSLSGRAGTKTPTMQDLFDLVEQSHRLNERTSPANIYYLHRLRRWFATYTVRHCTGLAISHYMASMQAGGRTPAAINRELAILRFAFRLGYQYDLVARIPVIKMLPLLAVRNQYFTRKEIDALLPHLPEYLRDVVLFGYLTGWRKGEITGLQWSNVDRSGGTIRLDPEQNKSRVVRVLVLHGELAELIERRWRAREVDRVPSPYVFHKAGRRLAEFRIQWLRACRQAGLGHRWFHSLRRSAARNMSLQGIPEKVIMSIMGHRTRGMFDHYNIVTEADQRAYAERLFGPQDGQ